MLTPTDLFCGAVTPPAARDLIATVAESLGATS